MNIQGLEWCPSIVSSSRRVLYIGALNDVRVLCPLYRRLHRTTIKLYSYRGITIAKHLRAYLSHTTKYMELPYYNTATIIIKI